MSFNPTSIRRGRQSRRQLASGGSFVRHSGVDTGQAGHTPVPPDPVPPPPDQAQPSQWEEPPDGAGDYGG